MLPLLKQFSELDKEYSEDQTKAQSLKKSKLTREKSVPSPVVDRDRLKEQIREKQRVLIALELKIQGVQKDLQELAEDCHNKFQEFEKISEEREAAKEELLFFKDLPKDHLFLKELESHFTKVRSEWQKYLDYFDYNHKQIYQNECTIAKFWHHFHVTFSDMHTLIEKMDTFKERESSLEKTLLKPK